MLDRRGLIRLSAASAVAASAAVLLDACGVSVPRATTRPKDFGLALVGAPSIRYAGEYLAVAGGYATAGLGSADVRFADAGSLVRGLQSSGVLAGVAPLPVVAAAVAAGAPLRVLGAGYQRNEYCLLSWSGGAPIPRPSGVAGSTVGVRTAGDRAVLDAWTASTGIRPRRVVDLKAGGWQAALRGGAVDALVASLVDDVVDARAAGLSPVTLSLADTGLPFVSNAIVAMRSTVHDAPGLLEEFLKGEVLGWTDAIGEPVLAANALVTDYGKDLSLSLPEQTSAATAQNALILTTDVVTNGLLTITRDLAAESIASLVRLGIDVSAAGLFDARLLDAVIAADTDLIHAFTVPLPPTH